MTRQVSLCCALALAAFLVLPGCASNDAPKDKPSFFASERHSSTSEVMAIDPANRSITLREAGEEPQTYKVRSDVRNLDQVRRGDLVTVDYYDSTAIRVLPPGEAVNQASATMDRAQPGEKPGGKSTSYLTKTVTVASVFPETSEVVTRDAAGNLRTWTVRDPKKLDSIKSGDRVQLTYTEMLAVRVSPAPAATTMPAAAKS